MPGCGLSLSEKWDTILFLTSLPQSRKDFPYRAAEYSSNSSRPVTKLFCVCTSVFSFTILTMNSGTLHSLAEGEFDLGIMQSAKHAITLAFLNKIAKSGLALNLNHLNPAKEISAPPVMSEMPSNAFLLFNEFYFLAKITSLMH